MKNQLRAFAFVVLALVIALAGMTFAQQPTTGTAPTATTLAAGVTSTTQNVINVSSVSGCPSTGSFSRVSNPCLVLIGREQMRVVSISGTYLTVLRGINGTAPDIYPSGAPVMVGSPTAFPAPRPDVSDLMFIGFTQYNTFSSSTAVNETTDVNGQEWYSALLIPQNTILTGACQFNGNGTLADKMIVILWDHNGNVLANSTTAGVAQSGTLQYQCQAFTSPVYVTGPQSYFVGVQGNGTTAASLATYAAGAVPTGYAVGKQSGTFGTVAAITTVPTSFTANQGPVMSVY